jgi:hypothetical protein
MTHEAGALERVDRLVDRRARAADVIGFSAGRGSVNSLARRDVRDRRAR